VERNERTVTVTRVLDAPRERVFAAWTDAKALSRWFGPRGFTVPSCEADPRPGGALRFCMRSPDGKDYWVRGHYTELVRPERLLITCIAEDDKGTPQLEEVIDVTFAERRGSTELIVRATASGAGRVAESMLAGMPRGWSETIDRLDADVRQPKD
jgi:uncharacterized protein YndB with AHSA1/START domain